MKKTVENRYPHSATLFKFCKEALEIRYEGNVKVIDQDVGSILGYDPADCSHWKKGKKNIHALSTLRSIADHLSLDENLLVEIAAGKIGLEEALFEYRGYGAFGLDNKHLEDLKKDFFSHPEKWNKHNQTMSIEDLLDIDRDKVVEAAEKIIQKGNFTECPIYMPEVFQLFQNIQLEKIDSLGKEVHFDIVGEGSSSKLFIKHNETETRPFLRFKMAKELFKFLCISSPELSSQFSNYPEEIRNIQANIFAENLLIPSHMLRKEVEKVENSVNLITQLADVFWVSTSLMNQRLRDYLEFLN